MKKQIKLGDLLSSSNMIPVVLLQVFADNKYSSNTSAKLISLNPQC